MSKKSWPNSYNNLLYEMGQDFLDEQYIRLISGTAGYPASINVYQEELSNITYEL